MYSAWSVVFGEQPSAAKWNILGTNDAYFDDYIDRTGFPVQVVSTSSAATTSSTTTMPVDNTIPQNTEGFEVMTLSITPTSATNKLVISVETLSGNDTGNRNQAIALFQDSTVGALAATVQFQSQSGGDISLSLQHTMVAGTASSTTFKVRLGSSGAGTTTFGNGRFGGIPHSGITITEYKV